MGTIWRENVIVVLSVFCFLSTGPGSTESTNLRTLKTMQVHACDETDITIKCWPNTVISIYFAQYGRKADSRLLCSKEDSSINDVQSDCLAKNALRVVESVCREKRVCDVRISSDTFGEDPCPGLKKYAEIAYKCRPNTFFNKVACEGEKLRLRCHKTLKIVIYSALFGATTKSIPECPHLPGLPGEDCQASYATETVMKSCHGRKKCSLSVDLATFGNPGCKQGTRLFLKVVYTCVPQAILKDLDIGPDNDKDTDEDGDYPSFIEEPPPVDQATATTPLTPPGSTKKASPVDIFDLNGEGTFRPDVQSDEYTTEELLDNCTTVEKDHQVIGFLTEWISAYSFVKANREKFILYLTLSLSAGLLAFLVVLAARLHFQRQQERKRAKLHITDPLPTAFDDSELDHYDSTPGRQDNSVEVVRYTNRSTMSRQDSDSHPRAPMSHNYYYS